MNGAPSLVDFHRHHHHHHQNLSPYRREKLTFRTEAYRVGSRKLLPLGGSPSWLCGRTCTCQDVLESPSHLVRFPGHERSRIRKQDLSWLPQLAGNASK